MKVRYDSDGLWWDTPPPDLTSRTRTPRSLAPIPESPWTPSRGLPSLSGVHRVGLDVETWDPDLLTKGPGWARGVGHLVGISLAVEDRSWYLPFRHTVQPELNLDPDHVLAWARDELPKVPHIIGANLMYDIGWLWFEGVRFPVTTRFHDVQFAEPLLNDVTRGYSLDKLAEKYLDETKVTHDLYRWCARSYGGQPTPAQRANIHRAPPSLVGPYAEADASLPMRILTKQYPALQAQGLAELFDIECRLIPLLIQMRLRGVRVDVTGAEQVRDRLLEKGQALQHELDRHAGFDVNMYNAGNTLARLFDDVGIPYPRTNKGAPSFRAPWLKAQPHPVARLVNELRRVEKMRVTFVEGYVLDSHINGRLFCQFHPLRTDDSGAVSGRFSSSTPNLQNIPARDPEFGPLIRGLFLPDEGYNTWRKLDYSQIEYRLFAHYSGDADLVRAYQEPTTDFHDVAGAMLGGSLPRAVVKTFNFMTLYGGGPYRLAEMLKELMNTTEATKLLDSLPELANTEDETLYFRLALTVQRVYADRFPAARRLASSSMQEATRTGEVRTVLGRVNRFPLFVPRYSRVSATPLPLDAARLAYGSNLERAGTHKALNRRLQGSAADLMKLAMLRCYEAGLYDHLGFPHLTVHDETDHSDPDPGDPAWRELVHIMENSLPLRVPVRVTQAAGPNWGHLKEATP